MTVADFRDGSEPGGRWHTVRIGPAGECVACRAGRSEDGCCLEAARTRDGTEKERCRIERQGRAEEGRQAAGDKYEDRALFFVHFGKSESQNCQPDEDEPSGDHMEPARVPGIGRRVLHHAVAKRAGDLGPVAPVADGD